MVSAINLFAAQLMRLGILPVLATFVFPLKSQSLHLG